MLRGKVRSGCGNSSIGANSNCNNSNKNMSISATNQKAKAGAVQVIKTTTTSTSRTATPKQATTTANSKLIKKAHVRFDDYLDLNEENMRRSCKRLMNHLYSDSTAKDNNNASQNNIATKNVAPATISHCRSQSQQNQLINECPNNMQTGASIKSVQNSNLNRTSPQQAVPSPPPPPPPPSLSQQQTKTVTSKGKSYLRSQYERRQLRQLELMQQETISTTTTDKQIDAKVKSKPTTTDDAIIEDPEEEDERRQQQDLMARSHELSKRRFFEKLERRESLKNLNLNINNITPIIKQKSKNTDVKLFKQSENTNEGEKREEVGSEKEERGGEVEGDYQRAGIEQKKKPIIDRKSECISNNIVKNADDELMLKAYQSILKGSTEIQKDNNDMLDRIDGAYSEEFAGELVAFYQPLRESANACEHEHKHEDQLIVLSTNARESALMVAETTSASQVASDVDESAFEIRVTGTEGDFSVDSLDRIDGFIKSNLLVVKQVEPAEIEDYQGKQDDERDALSRANQWLSTSNGRIEANETYTQMVSNKTETPQLVVNSKESNNSNKVILDSSEEKEGGKEEQISNVSGNEKRTCVSSSSPSNSIVSASKSMPIKGPIMKSESSTSTAGLSRTPIDGDNQQPAAGVSSTISSSSRSNCNEMKTISSLADVKATKEGEEEEEGEEVGYETTGIVERVGNLTRKSDKIECFNSTNNEHQETTTASIEVSEPNCAKNHESPETVMFVGQSGGASENKVSSMEEPSAEEQSTCASQIESAAQAQQVVNLQTGITKLTIRDVLPEASGADRKEIVSKDGEKVSKSGVSDCCAQVVNAEDQHKEQRATSTEQSFREERQDSDAKGQVEALETNRYANPKQKQNEMQENKTTSDVKEANINLFGGRHNVELMNEENNQLIKSFNDNVHTKLVQKQSSSTQSTAEEDNGSSCSSSGFGASASSSDGSASIKGTDSVVEVGIKRDQCSDFRRPNSLAIKSRDDHRESTCNPLYDCARLQRNSVRMQQYSSDEFEFPHYKRLVGPDQGYPSRSSNRTLVIENHNYASIVDRCELDQQSKTTPLDQQHQSISLERDDFVGYANLPRKKIPPVEYATVKPISCNLNNYNGSSSKNKLKDSSSEISLSAQSYSTTSGNSGGFSALPPAQVEQHSASNNFDSLISLTPDNNSHRKSSIFKRFGSLVSKAFTVTGNGTANNIKVIQSTTEINKNDDQQQASAKIDCQKEESGYNQNVADPICKPKLALVIEQDHHKVTVSAGQSKVEEADLVILPAKYVNQRKHQEQEQNLAIRRHDDDRLSRGKKHSRKIKQTDSSLDSASTTSSSSSYSSSSQASHHPRHHRHNGHLRKADSLSEDLESLMSRSEQSNDYGKQKITSSTTLNNKIGTSSNVKNKNIKSSLERIKIDCIKPGKTVAGVREGFKNSNSKQLGPKQNQRSVLRLLNKTPTTGCTVESTLNLIKSQPRDLASRTHKEYGVHELEVEEDEHDDEVQQPISGFWGFSSLMNRSHAKAPENNDHPKSEWRSRSRIKDVENLINQETSVYGNLQPLAAGYKLNLSAVSSAEERQIDKCQSLNLYQNLLRNYSKRRHRHHSHRGHHHHGHHHHHSRVHHATSRHAHHSTRCGKNCPSSTNSEISSFDDKSIVWGQLIKISKCDGSQVIELQRSPGRPWGFFVARGAINNTKGIFISRMHDKVTSDSLTGLLSIGDRILAIDECPIEPDYDILRVNQMISKKSKILLKVKPFKG